jgi:apolipoprotein N-acyltransferase
MGFSPFFFGKNKNMLNKRADKLELLRIAEAVALEKSIDKELIISSMEIGIAKAAKSKFGQENEIKILPLICYEIIFPNLIEGGDNKYNFIVNISEDAWFGESIGPYQHFSKAIFRSIESRRFVVRSANKGKSVFIDPNGKVIKALKPSEAGNIELEIPLIEPTNSQYKKSLIFFSLLITYIFTFFVLRKFKI